MTKSGHTGLEEGSEFVELFLINDAQALDARGYLDDSLMTYQVTDQGLV